MRTLYRFESYPPNQNASVGELVYPSALEAVICRFESYQGYKWLSGEIGIHGSSPTRIT